MLAERVDSLEQISARSEEKILNISLALNKTQGDMGQINEKILEVKNLVVAQKSAIKSATDAVDAQKGALIDVFRKQLADLESAIAMLEGDVEGEDASEEAE